MLTTKKTATVSREALVKTTGYKAAVHLFSNGKVHKYTEALGLYLQPQGATSNEVMAYYRNNGRHAEPMLNCYRKAEATEYAEGIEQRRASKGSTKVYKAYTLALTAKGTEALKAKLAATKATKASKATKAKATKAKATKAKATKAKATKAKAKATK